MFNCFIQFPSCPDFLNTYSNNMKEEWLCLMETGTNNVWEELSFKCFSLDGDAK
jgi:hypothetical protein